MGLNVGEPYQRRCGSRVIKTINAPLPLVWSIVRRFDSPHVYKKMIRACTLVSGMGDVGSVRHVRFISGMPGKTSIEQLEAVDEEHHMITYRVIDGDHKLVNFHVTTTLHEVVVGDAGMVNKKTVVIESYTVDVPNDSNEEDTCYFANNIIELNLNNLGLVVGRMLS